MWSDLIDVAGYSPNFSGREGCRIDRITVHHTAGIASVEGLLAIFERPERNASATYVIGNDGRIGGCVQEEWRPWTSNSKSNDQRAITIEVSNDVNGEPWSVSSRAWDSLIKLCVDICLRYDLTLWWNPELRQGSLTAHRWYAATACPGDWLYVRFDKLIAEVNKQVEDYKELAAKVDRLQQKVDVQQEQIANLKKAVGPIYQTVEDVPSWYRPYIETLKADGALKGTGAAIDVPELMARIFTILGREGVI